MHVQNYNHVFCHTGLCVVNSMHNITSLNISALFSDCGKFSGFWYYVCAVYRQQIIIAVYWPGKYQQT